MAVFLQSGVADVSGVDGDFIDLSLLEKHVSPTQFQPLDLSQPFNLNRRFDLVMSLEVAEHLPPTSARAFVQSLVLHGDTVIFSAANRGRGGQNHLNEQYLLYWAGLFAEHGYRCYDLLRPRIWNHAGVDKWYKQNTLVYSKRQLMPAPSEAIDVIHPIYWDKRNKKVERLMDNLTLIRTGKAGILFYLKCLGLSLTRFGRKYKM
jgi:hypothetical protein